MNIFSPICRFFADRNAVEKEETFELPGAARDRFLMEITINPIDDSAVHKALTFETRFHNTDKLIEQIVSDQLHHIELTAFAPMIQEAVQATEAVQDFVEHIRKATQRPQDYGIQLPEVVMDELMLAGMGAAW